MSKPRLGFLGVGWIGRHRMQAIAESGHAVVAAIAEPVAEARKAALEVAPDAKAVESFEALLDLELDGVVIATPSALHAEQSVQALERGMAVFCQKPLGRSAGEVRQVIDAAAHADRLLGVDLSYRFTVGMQKIRELVQQGELGEVFGVNLVFHNAYGPDKAWFYDPARAGGGCVMDLGIHLVDLALWTLGFPEIERVSSTLMAQGKPLGVGAVEDYAAAQLELSSGAAVQLACSWKLPAGCDCIIEASFYGTRGGASFKSVGGSFYDFVAERFRGTQREVLASPPEAWGGRAAVDWAARLAQRPGFDVEISCLEQTAEALDRIYAREERGLEQVASTSLG